MKLTEEEAIKLLKNTVIMGGDAVDWHGVWFRKTINIWKQKGWIKKTALERAREFVKMFDGSVGGDAVIKCSQLYEQAIKEAGVKL